MTKHFAPDRGSELLHCLCIGSIRAPGLRRLMGPHLRDAKRNLRFQFQLYCRCDQRNCHASQSREISRVRRKIRRGSRFGDGPRQICHGCGQIVRDVRKGDLERPLRNGAMLRLLDGATQLKDATAACDRVRPWRECWQRQAVLRKWAIPRRTGEHNEVTVPRILVGGAVLLGLLSTSFDRTMRLENPRPMSAPISSSESAPLDTSRLALVIGNSAYPDARSPLPQMTRDAEDLTNALRKDGFQVDTHDNATLADTTRAIDHLRSRVHLNSIVFVYFGGYGVQSDGQNYLVPIDAKIWSEEDVRRQGVSIESLLSQLKASGARVRLVVIEASRRNPYERRFRTYSHGLATIQTSENALILSSAAPGQFVEDPNELHSHLMTALLAQMDSSKRIEEVFNNTRNAVAAATQGRQIPAVSSTLTESVDLWQARSGAPPVSSVASAATDHRE